MASSIVPPTYPPDLLKMSVPLFAGGPPNIVLLGILTVQVYVYIIAFPKDRTALKTIVIGVYMLEILQTVLLSQHMYATFLTGHGNPDGLNEVRLIWLSVAILTGLVTFICQGLFAYRIWVLSKNKRFLRIAFYVIAFGCIVQLAFSFAIGIKLKHIGRIDLADANIPFEIISVIWYASCAIVDALIAVCMIGLVKDIHDGIPTRTRTLLQRIVRLTVGTASITAAISIIQLILIVTPVYPTYYEVAVLILGKMYSNSMMVMLNNRVQISSSSEDSLDTWSRTIKPSQDIRMSKLRFDNSISVTTQEYE